MDGCSLNSDNLPTSPLMASRLAPQECRLHLGLTNEKISKKLNCIIEIQQRQRVGSTQQTLSTSLPDWSYSALSDWQLSDCHPNRIQIVIRERLIYPDYSDDHSQCYLGGIVLAVCYPLNCLSFKLAAPTEAFCGVDGKQASGCLLVNSEAENSPDRPLTRHRVLKFFLDTREKDQWEAMSSPTRPLVNRLCALSIGGRTGNGAERNHKKLNQQCGLCKAQSYQSTLVVVACSRGIALCTLRNPDSVTLCSRRR